MAYKTEQEAFWAGEFGDAYILRNQGKAALAAKTAMFARIVSRGGAIASCLELGANVGLNLRALKRLLPQLQMGAVEINENAAKECAKIEDTEVFQESIFDFSATKKWDLTFTSGVLIHIAPDKVEEVYEKLYQYSKRYILLAEYYNPTPVEVLYRGNEGKLFKRDFAGEMLEAYQDLELIDYGFCYHRDKNFPADDLTWFLMEKKRER